MKYPKLDHTCTNWRRCKDIVLSVGVSDLDDKNICKNRCNILGTTEGKE